MNSAYSYKYANLPSDYYDYSYDAGTLTDIPSKNMYKKRNNMFTRISVGSSDDYDRDYSHHVGSGYGHHAGCYEEGVSIGLLLTKFLGIAAGTVQLEVILYLNNILQSCNIKSLAWDICYS